MFLAIHKKTYEWGLDPGQHREPISTPQCLLGGWFLNVYGMAVSAPLVREQIMACLTTAKARG
ncbi:hypothetical protein [Endozoicomonas euniceicola]|uniref:Uncharacterized protein n=1 Tax=Endozoicomonas euniceicola TaxID=1234143 RepID=A0ABY6GU92_9GAMM|nr:hypothetical protein [Endozoicomonas euniceicola]UYM16343.1 hypothetical protein NX720_26715 [Endozoicomonas euniceicola]